MSEAARSAAPRDRDPAGPGMPAVGTLPGRRPGIWELAWPSILTSLLYAIVGIAAVRVVGGIGPAAVAAVTTGTQVFFGMQAVMMAISVGTTALVARAWGAEDRDEAVRVTIASLVLGVLAAIGLGLPAFLWAGALAGLFLDDPVSRDMAAAFIRWQAVFNWAFGINFILAAALRAAGDARSPLWVTGVVNLANILLLPVLVHGRLGVPALGVPGAAIATGVALSCGSAAFLLLWCSGRFLLPFRPLAALDRARLGRIVAVGLPAGLEQVVFRIGFFVFLAIIGRLYGTAELAAYGLGVNILSVCFVVGFGFSIAGSTLVGQHLGAGDPDGAVRSGRQALTLAVLSMAAIGVTIIALAEPIARVFVDDDRVVTLAVTFIWILGAVQPLMAVEFALGGALRGAGDTRFPLKATLVGLLAMRCGLALLFVGLGLSVEWVYGALVGDYAAKALLLWLRFRSGRWKTVIGNERMGLAP